MEKRMLGRTGIAVTDVGLGCWQIGGVSFRDGSPSGWSGVTTSESIEMLKEAWNEGVNFFDTADAYGRGKSEVLVGMGLEGHKTESVIGTKVGNSLAAPGQDFSEPYIRGALEASLTRLEREYVDIYMLHGPPVDLMTDDLFALMADLKGSGKVRSWGVSIGANPDEGVRAVEGGAEVIQLVYNIIRQDIGNVVIPLAAEKGVGIIARVPLASGWLTGKYNADSKFAANEARSTTFSAAVIEDAAAQVGQLDFLLDEADSMVDAALRFILSNPGVSTVIPGAKNRAQLRQNISSSGKKLSESALEKVRELFG